MEGVIMLFFFLLGLIFGSFFCVVGMRLGRNESFIKGRSYCDTCHHPLQWYDLVPFFSFLFLRGRCRYCKAKIQPLCFFIELFCGLLFMIAYYSFGFHLDLILLLFAIGLTMIIFASDYLYFIIPDEVLLFFSICFLIIQFFRVGAISCLFQFASGILLFGFMYLLLCLGNFLFQRESLGGGDVKLLFVIGLVLDPFLGMISIFLGSLIALPISFFLYKKNRDRMIPFGPFLLIAFLILLFSKVTSQDIIEYLTNLSFQIFRYMI